MAEEKKADFLDVGLSQEEVKAGARNGKTIRCNIGSSVFELKDFKAYMDQTVEKLLEDVSGSMGENVEMFFELHLTLRKKNPEEPELKH